MDIEFWASRWKEGRIGFHEGRTNAFLERHVDVLGPAGRRVLVPLCGKAYDLAFLASRGYEVVGIEAVEQAATAFFQENGMTPATTEKSKHVRALSTAGITILVGDFFACTNDVVGKVEALWDRAALVALSESDRVRYVARLRELLPRGAPGLLVSVEYDESRMEPPPHSVREPEIRRLYAGAGVTQLEVGEFSNPKMREIGLVAVERCFALEILSALILGKLSTLSFSRTRPE